MFGKKVHINKNPNIFGKRFIIQNALLLWMKEIIDYPDFEKIDFRVGTIVEVLDFPEARKPAYKLKIDFGKEIGVKKSSAQIKNIYSPDELVGKQVVCVVNFKPKQIGPFLSEVLTTGFESDQGVILTTVDKPVKNGMKLF